MTQKQILSQALSSTVIDEFDQDNMLFGNRDGVEAIDRIFHILNDHSNQLQVLQPYQQQITLIRELVLDKFSGIPTTHNTRWKRNSLAHGGQVATDLHMIQQGHDLDRKELWSRGFRHLYGIEYEYGHDIMHDHTITNILNIHADALTLHICRNDEVVSRAEDLIEAWRIWANQKSERYPFRDPVYKDMLYDLLRFV